MAIRAERVEAVNALLLADRDLQHLYWTAAESRPASRDLCAKLSEEHTKLFNALTALNQEDLEYRSEYFAAAVKTAKATLFDLKALTVSTESIVKDTEAFSSLVGTVGKAVIALEAL